MESSFAWCLLYLHLGAHLTYFYLLSRLLTFFPLIPASQSVLVVQSCLTLCDPTDCSPSGASVHGILQARVLGWLPFLSPGYVPDPGIESGSAILQADFLPSEPETAF